MVKMVKWFIWSIPKKW